MKLREIKKVTSIALIVLLLLLPTENATAQIPILDIIKAAVSKVIKAIDLQIQRQQNKVIWLQNAQKVLENSMSELKLKEISEWTEKSRELYDQYFQELWEVKSAIGTYKKVRDVVNSQLQLAKEYSRAWNLLRSDKHFTAKELQGMQRIYAGIIDESLKNLDQLSLVITSGQIQISDGKRLELISAVEAGMQKCLSDIRQLNTRNFNLRLSRSNNLKEVEHLKALYGMQ